MNLNRKKPKDSRVQKSIYKAKGKDLNMARKSVKVSFREIGAYNIGYRDALYHRRPRTGFSRRKLRSMG